MPLSADEAYAVMVRASGGGWEAVVLDAEGAEVLRRACATEAEARLFASSVRQHLAWLSPERFRAYYRIGERG